MNWTPIFCTSFILSSDAVAVGMIAKYTMDKKLRLNISPFELFGSMNINGIRNIVAVINIPLDVTSVGTEDILLIKNPDSIYPHTAKSNAILPYKLFWLPAKKSSPNNIKTPIKPNITPINLNTVKFSSLVMKWDNTNAINGPIASITDAVLALMYCCPHGIKKKGIALFSAPRSSKILHILISFGNDNLFIYTNIVKNKADKLILPNAIAKGEKSFNEYSIATKALPQIAESVIK